MKCKERRPACGSDKLLAGCSCSRLAFLGSAALSPRDLVVLVSASPEKIFSDKEDIKAYRGLGKYASETEGQNIKLQNQ